MKMKRKVRKQASGQTSKGFARASMWAKLQAMKTEIIQGVAEEMRRIIPKMVEAELIRAMPKVVVQVLKELGCHPSSRPSPHHAEPSGSKKWQLVFVGKFPDDGLFTDTYIKDHDAAASLEVELQDILGNRVEEFDDESPMKIDMFVLDGDFKVEDRNDWTTQDFDSKVVQPRKGKGELLKGHDKIFMSEGVAKLGKIAITDNSTPIRSRKFRLGARVAKGHFHGIHIKEAVSEAFRVKTKRAKKRALSLKADPSHLKNIGNVTRDALLKEGIETVQDFLQQYNTDHQKLKQKVGLGGDKWEELVSQIESCPCPLNDKGYEYRDDASGTVLLLNCVFNIVSVTFGQVSKPYDELDNSEQVWVNKLRCAAYEKRGELLRIETQGNLPSLQGKPPSGASVLQTTSAHLEANAAATNDNEQRSEGGNLASNLISQGDPELQRPSTGPTEVMLSDRAVFASTDPWSTGGHEQPYSSGNLYESERKFCQMLYGQAASMSQDPYSEMLCINGPGVHCMNNTDAQVLIQNANVLQNQIPWSGFEPSVSPCGVQQGNQPFNIGPSALKGPPNL